MKKIFTSNPKIYQTMLSLIFSILFIFTALNISNPLIAYADTTTNIGQTMNLDSYSANETDESSNETAGYLYWAASSKRCGVMFYVVDEKGVIQTNGLIMDKAGQEEFGRYTDVALGNTPGITGRDVTSKRIGGAILGAGVGSATTSIYWRDNVSPVLYSNGWQANGSNSMTYLMEDSGLSLKIKGQNIDLPNWAYFVYISGGGREALEQLAEPDTKWNVIIEPVSVNYMYTNNTFANDTVDATGMQWAAGSPMPAGATNEDGWSPIAYIGTGYRLIDVSNNVTGQVGGGTYTYKLYNKQLPYSMCLSEDIDVAVYAGGAVGAKTSYTGLSSSVHRIGVASEIGNEGIAMASIDITGFTIPPIHTYYEPNGTPGNTEPPSDDSGTSGPCTIRKLYYTEKIASDGTIIEEATDYHWFEQTGTTAYISIDAEEGYEIEGWKASSTNRSLRQKSDYAAVHPIIHSGDSAQEILLDKDNGEKYLYIIYKKTEIEENPPQDYDFRLEQSQITKRVTFLEGMGPANTPSLVTHAFTWTAPAPSITSCQSHGGNGHHLNCSTVWDEEPRAASGTPGTPGYDAGSSGVAHSHGDSCYDTPCTNFQWTDNTTQLGITLDTSTINKAVVSKNWSVTYNATTVNTITTSNKYYKENTSTRSGTGANTQSISQFNFITVLFRGQDHLTLADWKNTAAPKTYLTTLAYDSSYNFKSANTPQGTRKSGTEYTETFATKFVNRSPDASTTYKATVGAHGICSVPSSNYTFGAAYTIPNIKVNIQVFWAQGVSPSASGTSPSTQTAGRATFYPYIRMRYDSNVLTNSKVYVLSQTRRTVTFYDYATVYITGGSKDLTITSNQWSTHSDAMSNILSEFSGRTLSTTEENRVKSSVLPGGATLSLSVNSSNTRQIVVKTIQAYLTGSGKTQVDVTGGTNSLPTDRTQLESIHTSLVSSVSGVASQAYIAQYICTGAKLNSSEMTGAQFVQPGQEFTGNGTRFSTDNKYHLLKIKITIIHHKKSSHM